MKRFLFVLIVLSAATGALAQTSTPVAPVMVETVSVTGTGKSMIAPDRFSFQVGVQTVANTVDEAVTENNRRVAAVIAALKKAGATDKDIQTSNFNIYPQQDYQEGRLPRILGYQVTNHVTVRSEKIDQAGKLLGIAIGAGVNTSSGLQFQVSDPRKGRETGLKAAFDDARAKAALLAQAAGRTLGRAIVISEGVQHAQPPQPMMRATMAMEARVGNADVPVEAGTEELSFIVSVTFELR
jgi:uncharacterized protein YggE